MRPARARAIASTGRRWLVAGCVALLIIAYLSSMSLKFLGKIAPQDEGILLVYPDLILRGLVPYRDFAAIYPPGNFYVIAAAMQWLDNTVLVERLVGVAYGGAILAGMYMIGARRGLLTGMLAASCALVMLHKFPYPGAYSVFAAFALMVFSVLASLAASGATSSGRAAGLAAASGALAGLLIWFRQDAWVVGTVAALVALQPMRAKLFLAFAAAAAAPMLAFGLFALWVSPNVVFESLVLDPVRMGPARKLALHWDLWLVGLVVCVGVNSLLAVRSLIPGRQDSNTGLVRAAAIVSLGLLPSVLQRADPWHVFYGLVIVAPMTLIALSSATPAISWQPRLQGGLRALTWLGLAALVLALAVRGRDLLPRAIELLASADRQVLYVDDAESSALQALRKRLTAEALPGQSLFVGPADMRYANYNDVYLYYYFPALAPASRYIEMNPGSANRAGSGLAEQLAAADWLILTDKYDRWGESNPAVHAGPDLPNHILQTRFCLLADYSPWRLYRRCAPP
jgi:hypothetical protein